jgi:hypothetical protein
VEFDKGQLIITMKCMNMSVTGRSNVSANLKFSFFIDMLDVIIRYIHTWPWC